MRALDCLEELALQKGLDGVSMRDVSTRVGISLSSLQYHYPSKLELINAFVHRAIEDYETRGEEVMRSVKDGPYLPAVIRHSIEETIKASQDGIFAMIEARAQYDESTEKAMEVFWNATLNGYAEVIELDHPVLSRSETLLAATLIASMIEGFATTFKATQALGLDLSTVVGHIEKVSISIPKQMDGVECVAPEKNRPLCP